ncbi:MAG: hypothetical protein IKC63_01350 [Clostridia bacterium]|nr:hypothetical protein [Clostridia bacterium]
MKFDRFLAKLFKGSTVAVLCVVIVALLLFTACTCTKDDVFLCIFCGCLTPETCIDCGNECVDACDASCQDCFDCVADCARCGFRCENDMTAEENEALRESCIGKCTVSCFDRINESCEE